MNPWLNMVVFVLLPAVALAGPLVWLQYRVADRLDAAVRQLVYVQYWPYETNRLAGDTAVTLIAPLAGAALVAGVLTPTLMVYAFVLGRVLGLA